MKRLLLLVLLSFSFVVKEAEALSFDDSLSQHESETIDFSKSVTKSKNMTRSGEQEVVIDGDKWDQTIKDAYKEKYPEYEGEVKIFDIDDDTKEIKFEDTIGEYNDPRTRMRVSAPVTGNPNSSIGKVQLYYFLSNGKVSMASGTAFKVANDRFATAGHVFYDKEHGYGWAGSGSVLLGCKKSSTGGITTTALYGITQQITNNDWIQTPLHDAWRSDFGHLKVRHYAGTAPTNLKIQKNAPNSGYGMSYGYNGTVNQVTFSKSSGNMVSTKQSKWFGWLYESSDIQIVGGMSGGPVMNASNEVIGINSNTGSGVSRFIKMQPRIADSFFK